MANVVIKCNQFSGIIIDLFGCHVSVIQNSFWYLNCDSAHNYTF